MVIAEGEIADRFQLKTLIVFMKIRSQAQPQGPALSGTDRGFTVTSAADGAQDHRHHAQGPGELNGALKGWYPFRTSRMLVTASFPDGASGNLQTIDVPV